MNQGAPLTESAENAYDGIIPPSMTEAPVPILRILPPYNEGALFHLSTELSEHGLFLSATLGDTRVLRLISKMRPEWGHFVYVVSDELERIRNT